MTPVRVRHVVRLSALEAVDVRVGTVEVVRAAPRSAKLVRLTVSFGDHRRRGLAAMKGEGAKPVKIVGRHALVAVNLEARKIMGAVSEATILDPRCADGITPAPVVPERPVLDGTGGGDP
jgi:tRNA-binding protein